MAGPALAVQSEGRPRIGAAVETQDELAEIEQRIHDLRGQYPNALQSVQLHAQLARYRGDPAFRKRYQSAMSTLTKLGFKTGRREHSF